MNLFSKTNFQITFLLLLIMLSAMHSYLLSNAGFVGTISWVEILVSSFTLAIICFVQSNLLTYYTPQKSRQLIILLWSFVFAIIWMAIVWFCMKIYFLNNTQYILFLKSTIIIRVFLAWQFISAIGFYNLLWQAQQFTLQQQLMQQEVQQLAKDAELYKLRQQMQPHFLFNSLNSINALITIEPKQARNMIEQLSDYLRATLKKEEKELTTLANEMQYLNLYLDIEKIRFGHRLSTNFSIDKNTENFKIPALLLQPVLENAIKFGLYNTTNQVLIKIETCIKNNMLQIIIINPYDATSYTQKNGTGFGLKAINRRLHLIYGMYDAIQLSKSDTHFTTKILIPNTQS